MSACEVCGEDVTELQACRQCGVRFCTECGYFNKHLCLDCGSIEAESQEEEAEDVLEESTQIEGEKTYGEKPEQNEEIKRALE